MIVISDTNILSSLAAAQALHLLFPLFDNQTIYIPPAANQELEAGLNRGRVHLNVVLQAIESGKIQILELSTLERRSLTSLPKRLNAGECEGIALSKNRAARFLSNDKQAIRYCQEQKIPVLNLPDLLRLLWLKQIVSQNDVRSLIAKMAAVERLALSKAALDTIFAPRVQRRSRTRR